MGIEEAIIAGSPIRKGGVVAPSIALSAKSDGRIKAPGKQAPTA